MHGCHRVTDVFIEWKREHDAPAVRDHACNLHAGLGAVPCSTHHLVVAWNGARVDATTALLLELDARRGRDALNSDAAAA